MIAISFVLCVVAVLLFEQAQIGRILLWGVPTNATIVATTPCSRTDGGNVTVLFADANGNGYRVRHFNFTPGCYITYHVGEVVAIRYVPSDARVLMTQPELDHLWVSLLIFGLGDLLSLGGGGAAIFFTVLRPAAPSFVARWRARVRRL